MTRDTSVLVLGGGLAGIACARELGSHGVPVTLVDRHDYTQFQPLLYQVATSQLPAEDIARPLKAVFADLASVEVVQADVETADLSERTLVLSDGRSLTAANLVVAAGAQPNFFGIPGAAEHAFPLYAVADAERLRLHSQEMLAHADEQGSLDVVVVGAGPTGVELAGAIAEIGHTLRHHDQLPTQGEIHIVDRGPVLLNGFSTKAHDYAAKKLTGMGAQLRLGTGVTTVREDGVDLSDGTTLTARTVVWAGGESASPIVSEAGAKPGRGGRLDALPDLSVQDFPGVYAVGDAANVPAGEDASAGALPQLGSVAQQSGAWAAHNIRRVAQGEDARPFTYKDKGIMAMIGRNAAVAEMGKHRHQVDGPLAFAAWLGVHAMLLEGVHAKTDAFLSWAWDYFDFDHAARLEASSTPRRIAWGEDDADRPHIDLKH